MNAAAPLTPPAAAPKAPKAAKEPKAPKAPKEKKESALSKTYPAASTITVLSAANPKRAGTKAHAHFELYKTSPTVGDLTKNGGSIANLAWDVGHGFVKVG